MRAEHWDVSRSAIMPGLVVRARAGPPRSRCVTGFQAPVLGCLVGCHNNTTDNLRWAIEERVFFLNSRAELPLAPEEGVFATMNSYRTKVLKDVGYVYRTELLDYSRFYTGRRRDIYDKAVANIMSSGLQPKAHHIKAFLKFEKLQAPGKAPRIISPRTPEYNVELGRYLRPLEHRIYEGIAGACGGPTVMKGMTLEQVAQHAKFKWDSFTDPVAVGLDATRFDQHVSVDALEFEHTFYNRAFKYDPWLASLLRKQLYNEVFATAPDGSFRYRVAGTRASGDMNTSLGNCILMCGMVHTLCASIGLPVSLINNGDDCVVFLERSNLKRFQGAVRAHFARFGFDIKVEPPAFVFEQVEFCQMHPVLTGNGWIMCRNPYKAVQKDLYTCLPLRGSREVRAWMAAVGKCGASITHGVPVFQSFYGRLVQLSRGAVPTAHHHFWESRTWSSDSSACEVTADARLSFWRAFGMSGDEQVAFETEFSRWQPEVP